MNSLTPSRSDENYRYTQIEVPLDSWSPQVLKIDSQKITSQKALSTFSKLNDHDFYSDVFRSSSYACDFDLAKINMPSQTWQHFETLLSGDFCAGRWELNLKAGQSLKVFETVSGSANRSLLSRHIRVPKGAQLEYFLFQETTPSQGEMVIRHFIDVEEGAEAVLRFFHMGSSKCQHRIHSRVAQDSKVVVEGATQLTHSQHVDMWIESEHLGPRGRSETTVWNVLQESSSAVFNGMISIVQGCPLTQAYQSNKTLLLSEKARVHTLPKLRIATDDVKCSHGASVASLDENQLFYLKSRGIDAEEARSMLLDAFTMPILKHLPENLSTFKNPIIKESSDGF